MTVAAGKTPYHSYSPGDAMAAEAIPFDFGSVDDLVVAVVDGAVLAYGTDYSISGDYEAGTASITALIDAGEDVWELWSDTPREQQLSLAESRVIDRVQYERELDRLCRIARELVFNLQRAVQVPRGEEGLVLEVDDLEEGDVFVYRDGVMQRHDRDLFVNRFMGGDATGALVPLSGTGSDEALRDDLADEDAAARLIEWSGRTLYDKIGELPLHVDDFESLEAAIEAAMDEQRVLEITGDHTLTETLLVPLTAPLRIRHFNNPTITLTGDPTDYMFKLTGPHPVDIVGEGLMTFDAGDLSGWALRIDNDSNTRADHVRLEGVKGMNVLAAQGVVSNASGVNIIGNYDLVTLDRVEAENGTSDFAGAVRQAIVVARSSFSRGPRVVIARDIRVTNFTVFDPETEGDCDGLVIFQNFEDRVSCVVDGLYTHNVQGRAYKGQNGPCVPELRDFRIFRDIAPYYGGGTGLKETACQYGMGNFKGVRIEYEGAGTHVNPALAIPATTVFDVSHPGTNDNGELDRGFGGVAISDVTIVDRTTGGDPIDLFAFNYSGSDTNPRQINIANVKVVDGLVKHMFKMQSSGQTQRVDINVTNLQCTFDSQANDAGLLDPNGMGNGRYLRVVLRNCSNLGADEACVLNSGSPVSAYGSWIDGGGNVGFKRDKGELSPTLPGLRMGRLKTIDADTVRLSYCGIPGFSESIEVRVGQTVSVGPFGDGTFDILIKVRAASGSAHAVGKYRVTANTAAIAQVDAAGGIDLGANDGTAPTLAGSEVGLWHDTTGDVLNFKASAEVHYVTYSVFGG